MEIFHGDLLVYQKVFSCSSPKPNLWGFHVIASARDTANAMGCKDQECELGEQQKRTAAAMIRDSCDVET